MNPGMYTAYGIERVIFGQRLTDCLCEEISRIQAKRIFAMLGTTLTGTTSLCADIERVLGDRLVGVHTGMPPHMPRPDVVRAAGVVRTAGTDLLLCVGGGSVIDAAKMVQLCLAEGVTEPSQLDAHHMRVDSDGLTHEPSLRRPSVRGIAVPTTLSGAEFSGRAGCTDPVTRMKHIFTHRDLAPRVVILDPWLSAVTPEWLWLSSGIRAVDHATEALCSLCGNAYADGLAMNALRLLVDGLPRCKRDPGDIDARLRCQMGVWSAMGVLQAGVPMGASHGIGHVLGGTAGVPHGYTSCVMLPAVLSYNLRDNPQRQQLVSFALGKPEGRAGDLVADLIASLGLPRSLREIGVSRDMLPAIAAKAMHDQWIHMNPRLITSETQVVEILESAY